MALSHKKLLKKRQKKQKKQRAKHVSITPKTFHSLPVAAAWESDFIHGIVSICFARRISATEYHISMYLLDTWALGVKDSYMHRCPAEKYENNIEDSSRYHRAEPGRLKTLIQDSVIYGKNNGFEPIGDYNKMSPFLNNINTDDSEPHGISFGENGQVLYIANPELESPKEIKTRLITLKKTLGYGNYRVVVPAQYENIQKQNVHSKTYFTQDGESFDIKDYPKGKIGRSPLITTTGEIHMITRLYYKVLDYSQVLQALQKLKCIGFVDEHSKGNTDFSMYDLIQKTITPEFERQLKNELSSDSITVDDITYSVGDSVSVVTDLYPDNFKMNFSGSVGRIVSIYEDEDEPITIEWDSVTLQNLPQSYIQYCAEHKLRCDEYYFPKESLLRMEIIAPRDSINDADNARQELYDKFRK